MDLNNPITSNLCGSDMFPQTRKMPLICLVEQGKAKKWFLTFIKSTRAMLSVCVCCLKRQAIIEEIGNRDLEK